MTPSLFVIQGRDQGARFEIVQGAMTLGRDASNTIQLHDTEASRRHAEIRTEKGRCFLVDLGSSNGSYVNGNRIESHALSSGDRIQLGSTLLLYTGPISGDDDLTDNVAIVRAADDDASRIVRSLRQEEGSELFNLDSAEPTGPWLARARSNLQVMYRTALAVSHTLDIDQLLHRIMDLIFEWVEADRGCIMLVDPETKAFEPKVRKNRQGKRSRDKLSISKTILDYVREHNEGVLTSDAREDDRWSPAMSIVQAGIREAICVPMQGRYGVVGAIYIDTSISPQRALQQGGHAQQFNEEHLKLMIAIAHQAALAVEDTRYYSAMVQAERLAAVGQTIAMLSHHVKNILQGIRGGSYLIEMGLNTHDEEVVGKGWRIVEKNQNKISALVLDMLTFSKDREPDPVPGDLNQVVADVVELMQSRADELGVKLMWSPAPEIPTLVFDPEGIHRAVLNVVTNAIDACENEERSGQVRVTAEYRAGDTVAKIIVEDNGTGIPADEIDQIFTIFVSKKGARGTGLGLPVSQKIIREHGGRIVVTSEPGAGSRFTIELPVVMPDDDVSQTNAD